jgi:hypothetical protein
MQVSLDLFIQNSLYRFKFVDYSEQRLIHHDNLSIYVIDQKSNLPDLVIYNKIFNKNNCFFDFRGREFYPFPRVTFKITKEIMTKIDSSHLFENEETLSFPQLLDNLTEKSDKLEIIPNILEDEKLDNEIDLLKMKSLFGFNFKNGCNLLRNDINSEVKPLLTTGFSEVHSKVVDEELFKKVYNSVEVKSTDFDEISEEDDSERRSDTGGFEYSLFSDLTLFNRCNFKQKENPVIEFNKLKSIIWENLIINNWIVSENESILGNFNSINLYSFLKNFHNVSIYTIYEITSASHYNTQMIKDALKETFPELKTNFNQSSVNALMIKGKNEDNYSSIPLVKCNNIPMKSLGNDFHFRSTTYEELMKNDNSSVSHVFEDKPFFPSNYYNIQPILSQNFIPQIFFYHLGLMNSIHMKKNIVDNKEIGNLPRGKIDKL